MDDIVVRGTLRSALLKIEEALGWTISELIPQPKDLQERLQDQLILLPTIQGQGRRRCLGHFWPRKWATLEGGL